MAQRRSLWRRLKRATRGPRHALLAAGITAVGWLLGRLPIGIAVAIARTLGRAAFLLLGTPRRFAVVHVGMAFPELSPAAHRQLVRATFAHAATAFAELALWPRLRMRPDYVRVEGAGALDDALARGQGALAIAGHAGQWELLAATIAAHGYPLTVIARRVNGPQFDELVNEFRRRAGVEVLLRDDPQFARAVGEALRRNRVVAILIDQDTEGAGIFVPFFGRLAHTQAGAAVLALRNRVPVVTAFIERRPAGGHLIRLAAVPVTETRNRSGVEALTARLTHALEMQIRRAPAEWVWWHERWRRRPPDERAPRAGIRTATTLRRQGRAPTPIE